MIQNNIRGKLVVTILGVAIVPMLLLGALLSWQSYIVQQDQVKSLQAELTFQASQSISFFLHAQEQKVLSTLIRSNRLFSLSHDQQLSLFSRFIAASKDEKLGHVFNEITLVDSTGMEQAKVSRMKFIDRASYKNVVVTPEFVQASKNKKYYSPVYFDQATGEPLMKVGYGIVDLRSQTTIGVLITEMNINSVWNVVSSLQVGKSGIAYIVGEKGRVVAHPNPSIVLKKTSLEIPERPAIGRGLNGEKSVVAAKKVNLAGLKLFIVTELPTKEALSHLSRTLFAFGGFIMVSFVGAIVLGIALVKQIVRPIESLAEVADKIGQGDLSQKAEVARNDEVATLAEAFNSMISRLTGTISALEKEKDFVQNVFESLTHPLYVIDANDYTVKMANSAANFGTLTEESKCFALTHNRDKPCGGSHHPCTIAEIKRTKKPVVLEHTHFKQDGQEVSVEIYGYPIFDDNGNVDQIIEYSVDITDRKKLEEQLRQAQKLESVGILAGGVAHDFNNLLSPIIGYSELALMKLDEHDELREQIKVINEAGMRASDLTRQLLAFSRKQVMEMKVLSLNELINNLLKLLVRVIGETIDLQLSEDPEAGNIKADPSQVEQIVMNLAINARDAMPNGGKLIFETSNVELDDLYCQNHVGISPGNYVMLSVTDTGHGFSKEVQERIFEPFYTTKGVGKGTGLGLSTVYGIVQQLNGHIFVYSEVGQGATFKVYFPEVGEDVQITDTTSCEIVGQGTESILVVDDEPAIRQMVTDTLTQYGYSVTEAADGNQAIALCQDHENTIDILLTDVVMPGMNGKQLSERINQIRPDLKVLFMSGYTDNVIVHQGALEPGVSYITKPLVPKMLVKKIREVLGVSP